VIYDVLHDCMCTYQTLYNIAFLFNIYIYLLSIFMHSRLVYYTGIDASATAIVLA